MVDRMSDTVPTVALELGQSRHFLGGLTEMFGSLMIVASLRLAPTETEK